VARRGQLDAQVPRWRALAERAAGQEGDAGGRLPDGSPDGRVGPLVLAHLARLHGDLALARSAADTTRPADLRAAVLFDQGAWAELAGLTPPDRASGLVPVGLRALYQQLAGRQADFEAALAEVKKLGESPTYTSTWLAYRTLMFARRPADALALIAKSK